MERLRITLLLLIACLCSASTKLSGFTCKEVERDALLKLKHSFIDPQDTLGSWVGEDCCNWNGVGCDNVTGHVIKLDLRGDYRWWEFPDSIQVASHLQAREVNPALLELKYLTHLDLSGNDFNWSAIPDFLGSMRHLQYLNLCCATFAGEVPHSLGNLTKLVVLDLGWIGPVETQTLKWAFKLKNLQHLDLSGVDLSQALDSLHIVHNLPSLSVLNLEECSLGNSHLIFRNSTRVVVSSSPLQQLNLIDNHFMGPIPHFVQNLSSIRFLDLSLNLFNETSLEWALKLDHLQYLDLSLVDLTKALDSLDILLNLPSLSLLYLGNCGLGNSHLVFKNSTVSPSPLQHLNLRNNLFIGLIPNFIQNLSSITFLDLSYNSFNSPIPSWLGNKIDLTYLNLYSNSFNELFPHFTNNLTSLSYLDLASNSFSGSFPHFLNNLAFLSYLDLASNSFNGSFPHFLNNLTFLSCLDLSSNQFSSSIPSWLASKRHLEFLDLSHNHFESVEGGIMNTIGHLCSLTHLDLSDNQLQEEVLESHVSFSGCSRYDLVYMDMHNNKMSGQLPTIRSLKSLQYLDLSQNNFEVIPSSFGELLSLESVNLSHNALKVIPASFGKMSSLMSIDLSYNHLSVVHQASLVNLSSLYSLHLRSNSITFELSRDWLPPFQLDSLYLLHCKFNSLFPKWISSQEYISDLDLSDTGIFGPLPDNIGRMPYLVSLKLAENHINGSIPRSLCELKSLEVLDLKRNKLTGTIPECLVHSQILGVELSSNELSCPIPECLPKVGALELLSLNNNSLEGELPFSLSNCENLRVLDVGKNNLHGQIPPWNGTDLPALHILI